MIRIKDVFFIKDGGKTKLSKVFSASLAGLGILSVIGIELFSTPKLAKTKSEKVDILEIQPQATFNVPEVESSSDLVRRSRVRGLKHDRAEQTFTPLTPIALSKHIEISIGSEVEAFLQSGGSDGVITAMTSRPLEGIEDTILPKGSLLFGQGRSSEDRLYISFKKAVLPDHTTIKVIADAFDQSDRMQGLKGERISKFAFRLASSAGLFFLGGLSDGMREDNTSTPFVTRRPSVRDAALNGASSASIQTGKEILEKSREEKSRIEVKAKTPILIIFGGLTNDE